MKVATSQIQSTIVNINNTYRIVLLYGENQGLVNIYSKKLITSYLGLNYNDTQVLYIDFVDLKGDLSSLYTNANSALLFAENKKIIILQNAAMFSKNQINDYIAKTNNDTLLIIQAGILSPKSALRKYAESSKNIASVACYVESSSSVKNKVVSYLKNKNIDISFDAQQLLMQNMGKDTSILFKEIDKLLLYIHPKKDISLEDVQNIVINSNINLLDSFVYSFYNKQFLMAYKYFIEVMEISVFIEVIRSLMYHILRLIEAKEDIVLNKTILTSAIKKLRPMVFFTRLYEFQKQLETYSLKDMLDILNMLISMEISFKKNNHLGIMMFKNLLINSCN